MKRFFVFVLSLLLACTLSSCNAAEQTPDLSEYPWELEGPIDVFTEKNDAVTISVYPCNHIYPDYGDESTHIMVVVANNTDKKLSIGYEYHLFIQVGDDWYRVPWLGNGWTLEEIVVEPQGSTSWELGSFYNDLVPGHYLYAIPMSLRDEDGNILRHENDYPYWIYPYSGEFDIT